jgi:molybdenum cofactor cytidylyltransferase
VRRRAPTVAAVVLAAGSSRRMGGPNKLLAEIDGGSVVARTVDAALASRAALVVVVTGHEAARVRAALAGRDVRFAHNRRHASGLASSLRRGLRVLDAVDGALICLADMPWVDPADLDALIAAFARATPPICVPMRGRRRGNPVLWPARHFAALGALSGDVGGRALLRRHAREVVRVPARGAGVVRDVDTPADLRPAGRTLPAGTRPRSRRASPRRRA